MVELTTLVRLSAIILIVGSVFVNSFVISLAIEEGEL